MKTEWDYTKLADAYLKRPKYAQVALDEMIAKTIGKDNANNKNICDVGAGAAHLTLALALMGFKVDAVEPNDAMRGHGINKTKDFNDVSWFEGTGEVTGRESNKYDLVTFGSSFNVCDRTLALKETCRLLKDKGYFACMWNHRDLDNPLQTEIEDFIKSKINDYGYGTRREDQTDVINGSALFNEVIYVEGDVVYDIPVEDFIEGWKSHATVERQSVQIFNEVIEGISKIVLSKGTKTVEVPYTTRIWIAQKNNQ